MKTGWHDITTAEWLAMQGKPDAEIYALLTGRNVEEELSTIETALVAEILSGFGKLPEAEPGINVESETIGQFETARSFLKRYYTEDPNTYRAKAIPHLFGIYRSLQVSGVWSNAASRKLTEACKAMPCEVVVPIGLALLEQVEQVSKKYDDLARDPDEAGNDEAGENELEKFGSYNAIYALSGGDILKHREINQLSVREVYFHLYYTNELARSRKTEANG